MKKKYVEIEGWNWGKIGLLFLIYGTMSIVNIFNILNRDAASAALTALFIGVGIGYWSCCFINDPDYFRVTRHCAKRSSRWILCLREGVWRMKKKTDYSRKITDFHGEINRIHELWDNGEISDKQANRKIENLIRYARRKYA